MHLVRSLAAYTMCVPVSSASVSRESKLNEWGDALERLWNEIGTLHLGREIYQFFFEQLARRRNARVVQWTLTRWYVEAQAACIRRLAWTGGNNTESLHTLLDDIRSNPTVLGKGRYGVSTSDLSVDIENLRTVAHDGIGRWASQNVAHIGKKKTATLDETEFNAAIDLLGDLLKKYFLLVKGGDISHIAPLITGDWQAPFREPWLPS